MSALIRLLDDKMRLLAQLLFDTGMRLMEALRLRSKDVDFDRHVIIVREAKGKKDRAVRQVPACPQQLGRVLRVSASHTGHRPAQWCAAAVARINAMPLSADVRSQPAQHATVHRQAGAVDVSAGR